MTTTAAQAGLAVLKTIFEGDGATPQMRDFNPTLKLFEPSTDDIEGGRDIVFPIQQQYQQGIGARTETQDLPEPGQGDYAKCDFTLTKLAFSVQITTDAWKKSVKKGMASFVNLVAESGTDVKGGFYRDQNWQLFGDGSGLRTTFNANQAAPVANVTIAVVSTKGLFEGMLIDIYTAGNNVPNSAGVLVTGIDPIGLTITLASVDVAIATTDEIYRAGNRGNEILGLKGFVSDTTGPATVQGITVANNSTWRSVLLTNGGTAREIERNLIEQAMRGGMNVDNKRPNVVIGGLIQAQKYAMMLVIKDEYNKADKAGRITLDYGYETLKVGNKPLIEDPDCPDDKLYFLHTDTLKFWALDKVDFVPPPDGKGVWYRIPGKPFFRADGEYYCQFGGKRRNHHVMLGDLSTTL